jgi:putative FmdB family regulatory protein
MPIYEYRCTQCDTTFSRLQPIGHGSNELTCPECAGKAKRILSTFSSASAGSAGTSSASSCASSKFS